VPLPPQTPGVLTDCDTEPVTVGGAVTEPDGDGVALLVGVDGAVADSLGVGSTDGDTEPVVDGVSGNDAEGDAEVDAVGGGDSDGVPVADAVSDELAVPVWLPLGVAV
jgi:hypothetical protein